MNLDQSYLICLELLITSPLLPLNLQALLRDPRTFKLFDVCDKGNNSPLHVAAKKGYLSIVLDLIEVGWVIND